MTVSSNISKAVHITNGAVRDYAFNFKVFKAGEISVSIVNQATTDSVELSLNSDYDVDGLNDDSGGVVQLTSNGVVKAGNDNHLVILRNMPFLQEVDYRPHDIFPANTHELALDIAAMERQELREKINRAVLAPADRDDPILYGDFQKLHDETLAAADEAEADALRAKDAALRAEAAAGSAEGEAVLPASQEEVNAGEEGGKYVSPFTLKHHTPALLNMADIGQTVESPVGAQAKADAVLEAAKDYIDQVSVQDASETVKGIVMLAKASDTTSTTKAVTPAGVAAQVGRAAGIANRVLITTSEEWMPPRKGLYIVLLVAAGGNAWCSSLTLGGGSAGGAWYFPVFVDELTPFNLTIGASAAQAPSPPVGKGGNTILEYDGFKFAVAGGMHARQSSAASGLASGLGDAISPILDSSGTARGGYGRLAGWVDYTTGGTIYFPGVYGLSTGFISQASNGLPGVLSDIQVPNNYGDGGTGVKTAAPNAAQLAAAQGKQGCAIIYY